MQRLLWYIAILIAQTTCCSSALELRPSGQATGNALEAKLPDLPDVHFSREKAICAARDAVKLEFVKSLTKEGVNLATVLAERGMMGRSCALVSSSGVLNRHTLGSKVDGAEVVMRFNDAPVHGFEENVGSKEVIRFVNMHWADDVALRRVKVREDIIYIIVLPGSDDYMAGIMHGNADIFQVQYWQVDALAQAFLDIYGVESFEGKIDLPTSGAVGMAIALSVCGHLDAYGMAATSTAAEEDLDYHYYEDGGSAEGNTHHKSFYAEKGLWRYLADSTEKVEESSTAEIKIPSAC